MAHCRLLFVGGRDALQKIFDNAPDSSSESKAELTIGADWISDYDWLDDKEKERKWTTDDFTKANTELYKEVIEGFWYECFDIRDSQHYGSFGWVNFPEQMEEKEWDCDDRRKRNRERVIAALKNLPDDTLFHFADSHW